MLFETFGRMPLAHAEEVNREAHDELCDLLNVPLNRHGGCILLRAPRAGHGKTHLLSRVRNRFGMSHETILLRASRGYRIDASTVLEDVVRHLLDEETGLRGLSRMEVFARRLMASALIPLIESGEVPCEDREAAMEAVRSDPLGTFDFHNPQAVTAQWAKESFPALRDRLVPHLARSCDLPGREISFWLDTLFRHASAAPDDHKRHRSLEDKVLSISAGEAGVMSRLEALLGLMALCKRVVLIADDLEGFNSDQGEALKLASLVVALRQSIPRLDVLISLNRDVWEGVFVPCLSDGLADRLSERLIELQPLGPSDMVALLESRVPGRGTELLTRIDRSKAGTHARGLIREAGRVWTGFHPTDDGAGATETAMSPLRLAPAPMPSSDSAPADSGNPEPLRQAPAVQEKSPQESGSLNPEELGQVEDLLRRFREQFGPQP